MKILIVSSFLPYPLYSGGNIRLYNLLKELSKKHEFTLIAEKRKNQTEEDVKVLETICKKVITVPRKKQWSLSNMIRSGFSLNSFLITGHILPEMKQAIAEELAKEQYDFIDIETSYVWQNVPKTNLPKVLVAHNVEYLAYQRFVKNTKLIFRSLLLFDVLKLKRFEQKAWKQADHIVAMSDTEANIIRHFNKQVTVVPNGVDIDKFRFKIQNSKFTKEKRILFIGNFAWMQNRDSARFIIKEIFPLIKSQIKNHKLQVKLWIVGKQIPELIKNLASDPAIVFDEYAPSETEKIYEQADVLLAPIRIGAGTQIKILEAMSSGVPVVTTRLGASGLQVEDGRDMLVADTSADLAEKTLGVLTNTRIAEIIANNARETIEKHYSWQTLAKTLDRVYEEIIQ